MMSKKVTKAPTGLTITRNGTTFTFNWKIGDSDYENGQGFVYQVAGHGQVTVPVGKKATSLSLNLGTIRGVAFWVRGNRKKYTKKNKTINPGWSAWASCAWNAVRPSAPSLTYTRNSSNSGTFAWKAENDASNAAVFQRVIVQTLVVQNAAGGADQDWKKAATSSVGAEGSVVYTETIGTGCVRWVRACSRGPAGDSAWVYAGHAYSTPKTPELSHCEAENTGSSTRIKSDFRVSYDIQHPIDSIKTQYAIETPDPQLACPAQANWTDGMSTTPQRANDSHQFFISDWLGDDQCLYVRMKAVHDEDTNASYSQYKLAAIGNLSLPGFSASVGTVIIDTTGGVATITFENNTDVEDAFHVILYRSEEKPSVATAVAIVEPGRDSVSVTIPELKSVETYAFGVYAAVGTYERHECADSSTQYDTFSVNAKMVSKEAWRSGIIPKAPTDVSVETVGSGKVRVHWTWAWKAATSATLAWADHEDAWESTDEPDNYDVLTAYSNSWIIAELEIGKKYYIRIRLNDDSGEEQVPGPWCDTVTVDLSSQPERPVISANRSVITPQQSVTASWTYDSEDGSAQAYAEVCEVSFEERESEYMSAGGDPDIEAEETGIETVYGEVIGHATGEQYVLLTPEWEPGTQHFIAVRTTSETGKTSEWSEPVGLHVAEPVNIDISPAENMIVYCVFRETTVIGMEYSEIHGNRYEAFRSGLMEATSENPLTYVTVNEETGARTTTKIYPHNSQPGRYVAVHTLPLAITVKGAGISGMTTLSIVRAENYNIRRPDEQDQDGYEGESVYTHSQIGEDPITIKLEDLSGRLDDGAKYELVSTATDEMGQKAETKVPFTVSWDHQPEITPVEIRTDEYRKISIFRVSKPEGYVEGDTFDAYRLSADRPEKIIDGGLFDTWYVDPFPAFGRLGGHRIVSKSLYGDYITAENQLAWTDTDEDDGDILQETGVVIEFGNEVLRLPYNNAMDNRWQKDFQRTVYLGGAVQGDWNPGVTRDLSITCDATKINDLDQIETIRDLAEYPGICHIRTPDGSSFNADVQVDESRPYDKRIVNYTFTVKKVDPQGYEGMTLEEWNATHEDE